MSVLTYGMVISGIRKKLKAQNIDSWLTDQEIWNLYAPYLKETMKELDQKSRIMGFNSIMQSLDKVDLIEVDKVEASCSGIKSGIKIKRTDKPIPVFMEGYWGPLIKSITSLDGSVQFSPTTPESYENMTTLPEWKYIKKDQRYYWYMNDHIYFPDLDFNAVKIIAVTEEDISDYKCDPTEKCLPRQEQSFNVPDYIQSRAESKLFQNLLGTFVKMPPDVAQDNLSILR